MSRQGSGTYHDKHPRVPGLRSQKKGLPAVLRDYASGYLTGVQAGWDLRYRAEGADGDELTVPFGPEAAILWEVRDGDGELLSLPVYKDVIPPGDGKE